MKLIDVEGVEGSGGRILLGYNIENSIAGGVLSLELYINNVTILNSLLGFTAVHFNCERGYHYYE